MAVVSVRVGGVDSTTARVVTEVDSGADVRLAVDTDPGFGSPEFFGPVTPSAQNVAHLTATGLNPETRYHFAVEHDSVLDSSFPGQFRTPPTGGTVASFTIAAASCAGANAEFPGEGDVLAANRLSNHPLFAKIRELGVTNDWAAFIHMGDLHYYDLGSGSHGISGGGSLSNYRRAHSDVLLQGNQHDLYRNLPIVYMYDDHDWGPNNSDGSIPGRANSLQAYRERIPGFPPAVPGTAEPNYHSFTLGRVLFVVLDTRANADPNSEGDSPAKTMLGQAQKDWLADLLATTTAEALVMVSTRQWDHPSGEDTWAGFTFEREEVIDILSQPGVNGQGWTDRMCELQGDAHANGIASAEGNEHGHFPIFQFASLDTGASETPGTQPWKDIGSFRGGGQFGTLEIIDTGDSITIEGTAFKFTSAGADPDAQFSHSFTIQVVEEEPEPEPEPGPTVPTTPGVIRTRVRWYGCDLVSGRLIAPLHDLTGSVSRRLGTATSASLTLPVPRSGPGAVPLTTIEQATEPGRTMVVAVVNDVPAWAGIVLVRTGGTPGTLQLGTTSIEGYLDRRYVRDHTFTAVDESVIFAGLIGDAQIEGIGLVVDAPPTGRVRTRQFFDQDDATVLSRLQELMRVAGGPEWTIDLDWTDDTRTAVAKIARLRPRIGRAASLPTAVFRTTAASVFGSRGSSETRYEFSEDYSDGRGANHVVATSSGESEDRPQSAPARAEDLLSAGWPRWERRWSPSSSIASQDVLDDHAAAELARRQRGARTWSFEARWDQYPRLNVDWRIGDDIGWRVFGHRHPDGVLGQGRAVGWDLDMQSGKVRPILLDPTSDPEVSA